MLEVPKATAVKSKIEWTLAVALDEQRVVVMVDIHGCECFAEPESVVFVDDTEVYFIDQHAERSGLLLSNISDVHLGERLDSQWSG